MGQGPNRAIIFRVVCPLSPLVCVCGPGRGGSRIPAGRSRARTRLPFAGWVSLLVLVLEWLRNAVQPPGSSLKDSPIAATAPSVMPSLATASSSAR